MENTGWKGNRMNKICKSITYLRVGILAVCLAAHGSVYGADKVVLLDLDDAMTRYLDSKEYVDGFQFYLEGEDHPLHDAELGEHHVTLRTSRSRGPKSQSHDHYLESEMRTIRKLQNQETCMYLFVRVAARFAQDALEQGATAAMDARSNYQNKASPDASKFACYRGSVVSGFGLTGTLVK